MIIEPLSIRLSKRFKFSVSIGPRLGTFLRCFGKKPFSLCLAPKKIKEWKAFRGQDPHYADAVQPLILDDPAFQARATSDIARRLGRVPASTVIFITHILGGGIERYINDRIADLNRQGVDVLTLTPAKPGSTVAIITAGRGDPKPGMQIDLASNTEDLAKLFTALNVVSIGLQSTVGWSCKILSLIPKLSAVSNIPYNIVLHDYVSICPRIVLINETGLYCGEAGEAQCIRCLASVRQDNYQVQPHPDWIANHGPVNILYWRSLYGNLLSGASRIVAPSHDVSARIKAYFKTLEIDVVNHEKEIQFCEKSKLNVLASQTLKVVVIGGIEAHKGFDILFACAADAKKRHLPLAFTVVGYTLKDRLARKNNIKVTGRYKECDVFDVLLSEQPHIAFLPSIWPETYCYTLSIAKAAGLPIAVFDLGAQAERVAGEDVKLILPFEIAQQPARINDALVRFGRDVYGWPY